MEIDEPPDDRTLLAVILQERYDQCNSSGHLDTSNGYCNFCYRTLNPPTPKADNMKASQDTTYGYNLGQFEINDEIKRERQMQHTRDLFLGIDKLREELIKKRKLKSELEAISLKASQSLSTYLA